MAQLQQQLDAAHTQAAEDLRSVQAAARAVSELESTRSRCEELEQSVSSLRKQLYTERGRHAASASPNGNIDVHAVDVIGAGFCGRSPCAPPGFVKDTYSCTIQCMPMLCVGVIASQAPSKPVIRACDGACEV